MLNMLALSTTVLLLAAIFAGASSERYKSFENVRVYKVELKDAEQIRMFHQVEVPVDVLNDIGPKGGSLDVAVAPEYQTNFEKSLEAIGASFKCIIPNLREILEERVEAPPGITTLASPAMEWTKYHSLQDIYDFIDYLATTYPGLVTSQIIGYTYENRPIKAMTISCNPGNKAIFMESNIHAVEWISSAASTCFINNLLTSTEPKMQYLKCAYDWILIPVANPDGFAYSKKPGRQLWRKNRKPTNSSNILGKCYGIDLNRNFDDGHFKEAGDNLDDPCSNNYAGVTANSELEVQSIVNFFNTFPENSIYVYLAWHSYGNQVLIPYGYTNEPAPTYDHLMLIAGAFASSAENPYYTKFEYGQNGHVNFVASGSGKDWAYINKSVRFAATLKLRPYSDSIFSFFLPAPQIQEVCTEVTNGIFGMMEEAALIFASSKK